MMYEPKGTPVTYLCSHCGQKVMVNDGRIIRECNHIDAAVVANVTATAYGVGGMDKD